MKSIYRHLIMAGLMVFGIFTQPVQAVTQIDSCKLVPRKEANKIFQKKSFQAGIIVVQGKLTYLCGLDQKNYILSQQGNQTIEQKSHTLELTSPSSSEN